MWKEPAHWDVFYIYVICDVILDWCFSLPSFITGSSLHRIIPVCVKHKDDFIIISCERHQPVIEAFNACSPQNRQLQFPLLLQTDLFQLLVVLEELLQCHFIESYIWIDVGTKSTLVMSTFQDLPCCCRPIDISLYPGIINTGILHETPRVRTAAITTCSSPSRGKTVRFRSSLTSISWTTFS